MILLAGAGWKMKSDALVSNNNYTCTTYYLDESEHDSNVNSQSCNQPLLCAQSCRQRFAISHNTVVGHSNIYLGGISTTGN